MSYLVHLQRFEGPMGLLLHLIRKEEMDIFDINIHEITRQYLDYIRLMKELDLEIAGEFVAMAATLIHIKSRMLLPQYNEEGEVVEVEDPRRELVQKLLEYQRYQAAGKQLYERPILNRDVFGTKVPFDWKEEGPGEVITEDEGLFSLISSYRRVVKRMKRAVHNVHAKVQSISSRIMELKDLLVVGTRKTLNEILSFQGGERRAQVLITFLSLLELGRMGFVNLFQNETYGDIYIETQRTIERNVLERVQEFEGEDAEAVARHIIDDAIDERLEQAETQAHQHHEQGQGIVAPGDEQLTLVTAADIQNLGESIGVGSDGFIESVGAEDETATDDEILAAELEIEAGGGFEAEPESGAESETQLDAQLETDAIGDSEIGSELASENKIRTNAALKMPDDVDAMSGVAKDQDTNLESFDLDRGSGGLDLVYKG